MEQWEYESGRYRRAISFLPEPLYGAALRLTPRQQAEAEELRLRAGCPMMICTGGEEVIFPEVSPTPEDLRRALETATNASYHAALTSLRDGFFTLPGGHRLGIGGTAVIRDGAVSLIRGPSSLALRLAHELPGVAECLYRDRFQNRPFRNTLILSSPGLGKTTFLRDLVRLLSDQGRYRVSLVDERGEVAALYHGVPQLSVGCRTDVLEGCPKGQAITMMLRSLSPQIIALDEITREEDLKAMCQAAYCGAALLATAHAASEEDLLRRPLYRTLWAERLFPNLIILERSNGVRSYRWKEVEPC